MSNCEDAQDGIPVTEALMLARHQQGQCTRCELQCRDVGNGGQLIPVTIEGLVLRGRCLLCRPLPPNAAHLAAVADTTGPAGPAQEAAPADSGVPNGAAVNVSGRNASPGPEAAVSHAARPTAKRDHANIVASSQESKKKARVECEHRPTEPPSAHRHQSTNSPATQTTAGNETSGQTARSNSSEPSLNARQDANRIISIVDNDGDVFKGPLTEGTFEHGKGRFSHVHIEGEYKGKSDVYEGEIRNGLWEGQGTFHHADGGVYHGSFRMGQYCGQGKLTTVCGGVYEGDFLNDCPHGTGEYRYSDGGVYIGNWRESKRHGKGKMIWASKDTYEGDWEDDKRHGSGVFSADEGGCRYVYKGAYKMDTEEGEGTLEQENGDVYKGVFKDGELAHGRVVQIFADGSRYEGEYANGNREGSGTFEKKNGSYRYVGGWSAGRRSGHGVAIDKDGDVYEGEWKFDKKHGKGERRFKNGKVEAGIWKNDKLVKSKSKSDAVKP